MIMSSDSENYSNISDDIHSYRMTELIDPDTDTDSDEEINCECVQKIILLAFCTICTIFLPSIIFYLIYKSSIDVSKNINNSVYNSGYNSGYNSNYR